MTPRSTLPIAVLASDATRLHCELLSSALKRHSQFEVLGAYWSSRELLKAASQCEPHVILLSAHLEDGPVAGLALLKNLRARHPNTPTVVVMSTRSPELAMTAFRNGARGVIFRTDGLAALCKCIRAVYEGQVWAASGEMTQILEALRSAAPIQVTDAKGTELLTTRQKQLVSLVAEGLTNREVSQQMHLSEHTVKNYIFRIFEKLGVSNRAELIIYTLQQQNMQANQALAKKVV